MKNSLDAFSMVDALAEYSRATRHSLIALESLHDLQGIDRLKLSALEASVRHTHLEAIVYLISFVGSEHPRPVSPLRD